MGDPDGENKGFLSKHAGALISVTAMLAINVGTWVYVQGKNQEQLQQMSQKITSMDNDGPAFGRALKWQVDNHTQQITELRADNRATITTISDIKAQIGVINTKLDQIIDTLKKTNPQFTK